MTFVNDSLETVGFCQNYFGQIKCCMGVRNKNCVQILIDDIQFDVIVRINEVFLLFFTM